MTPNQIVSLGFFAAVTSVLVWFAWRGSESGKKEKAIGVNKLEKDSKQDGASSAKSKSLPSSSSEPQNSGISDEKSLHQQIEQIDKRGKVLFKNKQFMEAAETFTEALTLIDNFGGNEKSTSLRRQIITLTNNRSAMYEKAGLPDLALHDCDVILKMDLGHTKARTRRLRILETQERWNDALVEVCALQLKFVQENRDQLRLGLPITPPVPQSKLEELMAKLLPDEVKKQSLRLQQKKERTLPSKYTILQLMQSFSGYNAWMAAAAKDGQVEKISNQIEETTEQTAQAVLLMKKGRRHAYDRKFEEAKQSFEQAYELTQETGVLENMSTNDHARLLEWMGMSRHLQHDLDGALLCYEQCSDLEPTNAEILVKRAGVKMDAGNQEEALSLFDTALGLDPDAVDALLHRANLRMLQQKPDEAKVDLKRCLQLRPDHLLARLRLATILMANNEVEEAKEALKLAESLDPESSEVNSYWGEMHFAQGELPQAKERFEKAMKADPLNPSPYVNSALVLMNTPAAGGLPDVPEAIRLLEKAIEIDPSFHAAYVHLGQLRLSMATELDKARDVIALYDKGLENCRTPEELSDICSMRILTVAQVDAATMLKMETLNMQ
eukprot:CAMPEP_0118682962 /NCGR_PEP_ID=MMETSP0800-20121206/5774_1 /TAXON_ID=210618 ORGANISM="Striatella unipunctata, Strain CCMP2910" /NCGR_SAMPLE_ID=MMETSP0800 /ASSEMBLY_ACC=CAM_ASM_000638 /LENGTH=610 /DNA_ID=CAMNT_0006579405 /DNA_START=81 /DNA_END=1913 /DNA_ORIENTATION=-